MSGGTPLAVASWRDRRRWVLPGVTLLVIALLSGTGWWATTDGPLAGWRAAAPATWHSVPAPSGWAALPPPSRLRIPTIGVDSPLEPLTLDATGALETPYHGNAGWYTDGTSPGEQGPAIIAGHVDSATGPAVFHRLHQLSPGDVVEVARGDRWVRFRVVNAEWYPKRRFPTALVYGPTPDAQLRLITCGGAFDRTRRSYLDNLVVYAVAL